MRRKALSISTKYILAVVVLILAATLVLGVVMINQSKGVMRTLIRKNMLDVSNSAAALLDDDALGALTETVFKRADEQMYFDKGEYYRNIGNKQDQ